jgi:hypothetical protein
MPRPSIFAAFDPWVALYAAVMATLISLLLTGRARNAQRALGLPLSSWWAVIPDTGLGTLLGTGAALWLPQIWPVLNTITGVGLVAGVGGVLGPKFWDVVRSRGLDLLLDLLAVTVAGPVSKVLASRQKGGDQNGNSPPPAPTPGP